MARRKRNELIIKILLKIEKCALTTAQALNAIDAPAGKSVSKESYRKFYKKNLRERIWIENAVENLKERQSFYSTISKLRK